MIWLIAIATGWAVVAVLLGLLIGNGIRIASGAERPACAETTAHRSATQERATEQTAQVSAEDVAVAAAR